MTVPGRRQSYITFSITMVEGGGVLTPAPVRRDKADAVIDTDHRGRPHIPGTSLAGALRAEVERVLGPSQDGKAKAEKWFGHVSDRESVASPVWVLGTALQGDDASLPDEVESTDAQALAEGFVLESGGANGETWSTRRRWMSTAINRHTGAARVNTLRQHEFLPAGTKFEAHLRWDEADQEDVKTLIDILAAWQPLIGRGTSTGRGRCQVSDLKVGELDLSTQAGLELWLTLSGVELAQAVARDPVGQTQDRTTVSVCIHMQTEGPLAVGARGQATRHTGPLPFRRMHNTSGTLQPAIPATSIKGVVRSRMEYILRSLGVHACMDQKCGRDVCLPCQVFGHGGAETSSSSVGLRSRVRVDNAFISARERWPADPPMRVRTHAPLDRFTGGVGRQTPTDTAIHLPGSGGGMLHSIEGVEGGEFTLQFDTSALAGDLAEDFRALLRLVIEDLHDGLIGLGHAVNRGYGSVQVVTEKAMPGRDLVIDCLPTGVEARKRMNSIMARFGSLSSSEEPTHD
ncbi:MAG: hypothetical protein IPN45_04660 [Actinomycetales bacterium]|nr:hypothetical protein [Actinomycetales bacterium]